MKYETKVLIVIPHIFDPKSNDTRYSSQKESKRKIKEEALKAATEKNLRKHNKSFFIHASLGKGKKVVTRAMSSKANIKLEIQLYTKKGYSLAEKLRHVEGLKIIELDDCPNIQVPCQASQKLLEQAENYDILGYMEDDILIEDSEFFAKVRHMHKVLPEGYAVIPHRCEYIEGKGDVILSGDPDGGRNDLYWDTGEEITIDSHGEQIVLYRATNPHSGCFFISQKQAKVLYKKWFERNWRSAFTLSGPLEQAASGRLLESYRVMKPVPSDYRYFKVTHLDSLWEKHDFE